MTFSCGNYWTCGSIRGFLFYLILYIGNLTFNDLRGSKKYLIQRYVLHSSIIKIIFSLMSMLCLFSLKINFKKLISWWKEQAALSDLFESNRAKEVLKRIEKTPELSKPFDDFSLVEKYQEEIQLLLSPFFPSLTTTNEIKAAGIPFRPMLFNLTKRFTIYWMEQRVIFSYLKVTLI